MKTNEIIYLVAGIVFILLLIIEKIVSKTIATKLAESIYAGDFVTYDKLRNSKLTRYLFRPFNLEFSDLNKALIQGDIQEIEKSLEKLEKIRMNKRQKETLYTKVFYYYVLKQQKEGATKYYHLIKDLEKEDIMKDVNIFYDTFIMEGHEYLDELLEALTTIPDDSRADYESIVSKMYENKGDKENARKYKIMAEEHFQAMKKSRD